MLAKIEIGPEKSLLCGDGNKGVEKIDGNSVIIYQGYLRGLRCRIFHKTDQIISQEIKPDDLKETSNDIYKFGEPSIIVKYNELPLSRKLPTDNGDIIEIKILPNDQNKLPSHRTPET